MWFGIIGPMCERVVLVIYISPCLPPTMAHGTLCIYGAFCVQCGVKGCVHMFIAHGVVWYCIVVRSSPEHDHKIFIQCHGRHSSWVACPCDLSHLSYHVFVRISPIKPWVPQADCLYLAQMLEQMKLGHQLPSALAKLHSLGMQMRIQAAKVSTKSRELQLATGVNYTVLFQDTVKAKQTVCQCSPPAVVQGARAKFLRQHLGKGSQITSGRGLGLQLRPAANSLDLIQGQRPLQPGSNVFLLIPGINSPVQLFELSSMVGPEFWEKLCKNIPYDVGCHTKVNCMQNINHYGLDSKANYGKKFWELNVAPPEVLTIPLMIPHSRMPACRVVEIGPQKIWVDIACPAQPAAAGT